MRHVLLRSILLLITFLVSSCCQAPQTQAQIGSETVAIVGQVVTLEPPLLTISSGQTITSQLSDQTRILSDQGDTLESTTLTPGTTIWLSMTGNVDTWHAQEIRVLPR